MPALKLWSRPPPDDEPTHPDRDAPGLRVENVDELDAEEPTLVRQPRPYVRPLPEEVERLAFPRGITDETLIVGTRPNGYAQMRAWLVRCAAATFSDLPDHAICGACCKRRWPATVYRVRMLRSVWTRPEASRPI